MALASARSLPIAIPPLEKSRSLLSLGLGGYMNFPQKEF